MHVLNAVQEGHAQRDGQRGPDHLLRRAPTQRPNTPDGRDLLSQHSPGGVKDRFRLHSEQHRGVPGHTDDEYWTDYRSLQVEVHSGQG